jgi:hypothetical protein
MREKNADLVDVGLVDLDKRRWVRFEMPVLVCVDTDENGDQYVRHVVPQHDDLELARDDRRDPVVYGPDGIERAVYSPEDTAAWRAVEHAGQTKDTWVGEQPYLDWGWWENPEDLTASDRYAQDEDDADGEDDEDDEDDLEWTPIR